MGRGFVAAAAVAAIIPLTLAGGSQRAAAGAPPFTKTSALHLSATRLGPNADQTCDIVYDLYVPTAAGPTNPVPSILTTNGFGGSKDGQAGVAALFATHGYEVISYSGLGFGGSSCSIELDSPEWDGQVASRFLDLLAARPEVAKDGPNDPVVGTWGGSYGGAFQFALASVDPRLDAMIPIITWNDLSYSLAPNNDSPTRNYTLSPPGAPKYQWTDLFFAVGASEPAMHPGMSGNPPTGCPGFDAQVCVSNASTTATGFPDAATTSFLRHASAEYELFDKPGTHVPPTMLIQGQNDTLFNFNDAVANYNGLVRRGAGAKLVLQEGGHSGPAAPGEVNDSDPATGYLDQLYLNWYDHYLKHLPVSTGPAVEYFQDWVQYDHAGSAQPAYASSPSYPVGSAQTLYLSGGGLNSGGSLVSDVAHVQAGSQSLVSPPNGQPSSYSETSAVGAVRPPSDPAGEFASFITAPLTAATDVVGIPEATFTVSSPLASSASPATQLVLFGKLYDVDPGGGITLVHGLVSPIRVADPSKPVHINLPGQVHRYAAGHRIELVLASTDSAYIGNKQATTMTISVDPAAPSTLTLPVAPAAAAVVVPESPLAVALPVLGIPVTGIALGWCRRRRRRPEG